MAYFFLSLNHPGIKFFLFFFYNFNSAICRENDAKNREYMRFVYIYRK